MGRLQRLPPRGDGENPAAIGDDLTIFQSRAGMEDDDIIAGGFLQPRIGSLFW